jgi:uncharacterized membrane protein
MNKNLIARIGFLLTAAYLLSNATTNWYRGQIYVHHEVVVGIAATYLIAFGLIIMAFLDNPKIGKYGITIFFSLIFCVIFSSYIITNIMSKSYGGDPLVFNHYSASLVLKGENPYTHSMAPGYQQLAVGEHVISPTLSGGVVDNCTYPALSFLIYVPFLWGGVTDIRWINLLFYIAAYSIIYFKAPKELKPVILLPLFMIPSFLDNIGGNDDIIWVVILIVMALNMKRIRLSGLLFGLACAFKQTPLVIAPFLFIWVWKSNESLDPKKRIIKIIEFSCLAGAVFLAFNLPFILSDFKAWYIGVLTPFMGPVVPHGAGLSMFSQLAIFNLPKSFYTIATLIVTLTLVEIYYSYFDRIKYAIWVFPPVIFWFSYRSLDSYFIFWVPLLLISISMWYITIAIERGKSALEQ